MRISLLRSRVMLPFSPSAVMECFSSCSTTFSISFSPKLADRWSKRVSPRGASVRMCTYSMLCNLFRRSSSRTLQNSRQTIHPSRPAARCMVTSGYHFGQTEGDHRAGESEDQPFECFRPRAIHCSNSRQRHGNGSHVERRHEHRQPSGHDGYPARASKKLIGLPRKPRHRHAVVPARGCMGWSLHHALEYDR